MAELTQWLRKLRMYAVESSILGEAIARMKALTTKSFLSVLAMFALL